MLGPAVTALREAIDLVQSAVRDLEAEAVPWSQTRDDLVELEGQRERLEHAIGSLASDCAARRAHEHDVRMVNGRPRFSLPDGTTLHEPRAGPAADAG